MIANLEAIAELKMSILAFSGAIQNPLITIHLPSSSYLHAFPTALNASSDNPPHSCVPVFQLHPPPDSRAKVHRSWCRHQGPQLPLVVGYLGIPAPTRALPSQVSLHLQEVSARSHGLLLLQCVLSPSSAAGAMERWEEGSGSGGGSMAAWPLAQDSISQDFDDRVATRQGRWGWGVGTPALFQPPPLSTSSLPAPRTQSLPFRLL